MQEIWKHDTLFIIGDRNGNAAREKHAVVTSIGKEDLYQQVHQNGFNSISWARLHNLLAGGKVFTRARLGEVMLD